MMIIEILILESYFIIYLISFMNSHETNLLLFDTLKKTVDSFIDDF